MVDFERVVFLSRSQGMRDKEFAAALGINSGHLWRLKTGRNRPSSQIIEHAAELLGVPVADFSDNTSGEWNLFHQTRADLMRVFHEQFRHAESVLTVTNSLDSYLQDEWMLEWSNRVWQNVDNWDVHARVFYPYAKEQTFARVRSNFLHRIACPLQMFTTANHQATDWLDQIRHGLGEYEEITVVTPIRDWSSLERQINALLPPVGRGWEKICIVDTLRVLVHIHREYLLSCSNEGVVQQLKAALESVLVAENSDFLRESKLTPNHMKSVSFRTQSLLERILRDAADRDRAALAQMAFLRMLQLNRFVPPSRFLETRSSRTF